MKKEKTMNTKKTTKKTDSVKEVSKAHTIYKMTDGTRVPGATTITGLLNKPYLVTWANKLGLDGIDSSKYTDEAAKVGTLAHEMIQCNLQNMEPDLSVFSPVQVDLAENAILSFFEWKKQHTIEPILCETAMVSDSKRFGGTCDCYCKLDGIPTLLDFKTGKAIYEEYFVQVAAYKELLIENGYPVEQVMILRVGRDETEGFEHRSITDTRKYYQIFENLLNIYYLKKQVGWK